MPDDHQTVGVEPPRLRPGRQQVHGGSNVQEGPRIAAARRIHPAIFDAPDGHALRPQGAGQAAHLGHALVLVLEAAPVDQHDHRKRTGSGRLEQLDELSERWPVGDVLGRRRALERHVFVQGHGLGGPRRHGQAEGRRARQTDLLRACHEILPPAPGAR